MELDQALTRLQLLQRQNMLLMSQIARAAKCFLVVSSENSILKAELQALNALPQQ